jgi:hypothetical protein
VITVDGSLIFIADPRAPAKLSSLQKSFLVLEQKPHYFEIVKNRQNNFLTINGNQSLFVRNSHGKITLKKPLTSQYLVDLNLLQKGRPDLIALGLLPDKRACRTSASSPAFFLLPSKHCTAITLTPGGTTFRITGDWKLLGGRSGGAGGQNRTGYARLFRAALYH